MISDVLTEAVRQINSYLKKFPYQEDDFDEQLLIEIDEVVGYMESLRRRLDAPPTSD